MLGSILKRAGTALPGSLRSLTSRSTETSHILRACMSTSNANQGSSASGGATPKPVITSISPVDKEWKSRAFREDSRANYKNLPISPHKLQNICRTVSGLSAREALVQLRLSSAKKSVYVAAAIRSAQHVAKNRFNMNKARLVVSEAYCTKGAYYKRVEFRARGRANVRHRRHSHLTVVLKEQEYHPHEIRIGRYGRTIKQIRTTTAIRDAYTRRRKAEGGSTHKHASTSEASE